MSIFTLKGQHSARFADGLGTLEQSQIPIVMHPLFERFMKVTQPPPSSTRHEEKYVSKYHCVNPVSRNFQNYPEKGQRDIKHTC